MNSAEVAKTNMIQQQIRPWEVLDGRVLATLDSLDRADFVADAYTGLAYADCQIPVAGGARMLPPTIEGRLLQALALEADDEVLELGCAGGYLSACLAKLAGRVTVVDSSADRLEFARQNLAAAGIGNVELQQRSPAAIDPAGAYDAIAVTGSCAALPDNFRRALRTGGRLFIVVGQSPVMEALLITRLGDDEWSRQSLFETDLPRLAD